MGFFDRLKKGLSKSQLTKQNLYMYREPDASSR